MFYRQHLPFVRSYLARRIVDPFAVADLTADVFVRVISSPTPTGRTWASPQARAVQRLEGRRLLDEDSTDLVVQRISAESDARALVALIAHLPGSLRDEVELVAVDSLTLMDAAAVLGISHGAARSGIWIRARVAPMRQRADRPAARPQL